MVLALLLAACGGGGSEDPCEPEPGATQVLGCAICVDADGSECILGR